MALSPSVLQHFPRAWVFSFIAQHLPTSYSYAGSQSVARVSVLWLVLYTVTPEHLPDCGQLLHLVAVSLYPALARNSLTAL